MHRLIAPLLLVLLLAGCGPDIDTREVTLVGEAALEDSVSTPVDLVWAGDRELAERLTGMTGPEWFAERDRLLNSHPEALEATSYQVNPGSMIEHRPAHQDGAGLFVFAQGDGEQRLRIEDRRHAVVQIGRRGLSLLEPPSG